MSSPVRSRLSPKVLNTFLKSPTLKFDPLYTNTIRHQHASTKLNNEKPINTTSSNSHISVKSPILINTPNKNNLLQNGLLTHNIEVLGHGSFGVVVKDDEVAVKIVKIDSQSMIRERNALSLSHKNIVKVLDIIINYKGNYGIVLMEFIKSARNLLSILDNEKILLTPSVVKQFSLDICYGLQHSHSNNILHLDLKPNNILVCDNNVCKICDFGNSMKIGEDINYKHQGNVAYTAPEILMGHRPTTKCDVYSLGILFWQIRHRTNPYPTLDVPEMIIYKVVKFNLRPWMHDSALHKDPYKAIYCKCWNSNPVERPEVTVIIDKLLELK